MYQWLSFTSFVPLSVLLISACEASQMNVGGANQAADQPLSASKQGKIVPDRRTSINQRFKSLDDYLAHLERTNGPMDRPWYKQVRPGIYELQTGNLRTLGSDGEEVHGKHTFTREELERKFGFK